MELEEKDLVLKSLEIERCYMDNPNKKIAVVDIPNILKIGQLIRLANMIRKRKPFDFRKMRAIGAIIEMSPDAIERSLETFEKLDWVDLKRDSNRNYLEVNEKIPPLSDVMNKLGSLVKNPQTDIPQVKSLNKFEEDNLKLLKITSNNPITKEAILNSLNITDLDFKKIIDFGKNGNFFDQITLKDEEEIIISPIIYYNKYEPLKKSIEESDIDEFNNLSILLEHLKNQIGIPFGKLRPELIPITEIGIEKGWLQSFKYDVSINKQISFLFAPLPEFKDTNPLGDVFEKCKTVISTMRYGQYYAETSKILSPDKVIEKLVSNGTLDYHSHAAVQYKICASKGICEIEKGTGRTYWYGTQYEGYRPIILPSEENTSALELVRSLLKRSDPNLEEILISDIENANKILNSERLSLDTFEYRGALSKKIKLDKKMEQALHELAVGVAGGRLIK